MDGCGMIGFISGKGIEHFWLIQFQYFTHPQFESVIPNEYCLRIPYEFMNMFSCIENMCKYLPV
jgi:hypothetical protein